MTGYKSKRAAALDEEGVYLVHHTDHSEVVLNMVAQRPWIGLTDDEVNAASPVVEEQVLIRVMEAKLKDKNNG